MARKVSLRTIQPPSVAALLLVLLSAATFIAPLSTSGQAVQTQASFEIRLKSQYEAIQRHFASTPRYAFTAADSRLMRRIWQDELAKLFTEAAATVEEILKLNPAQPELWRERLETLRVYAKPIASSNRRTIYGASEVNKKARLVDTPSAVYTDDARAANANEQVRIRLVLASDGTVKHVFPIKSARYGLTESALTAALQIKFDPATLNGQPVSQFVTLVYEFNKKDAKPVIPRSVF